MTREIISLSYRRHHDLEAGISRSDDDDDDPFHITSTKHAPINRLRRWRQAALVLNASRRFRHTLDLKKDKEKQQTLMNFRVHVQAVQAAYCFQEAGQQLNGPTKLPSIPNGEFSIEQEQLSSMTRGQNITVLQQYKGVKGLSDLLKTNLDKGISGDDADLLNRRNVFGSNTYNQKKGMSFWMFLWEAWQDLTLIILMVAAVASLALGIKTQGIKEGWYDGGSIAFAVILVIVVTAISDYRQSLLFQNSNDEKRNICLEVIRGGRRVEVSIYDLVVGDVVPLNIGDQVPADGVVISGHSLSIDESSMTGENKIVHKDSKNPFLMSGCKVADGIGTMLVTGVGVNTEWGLRMADISEESGEETPLQVRLNGVATYIGIVGLAVAFIVLVVLLARFFTGHTKNPDGSVAFTPGKTKVGDAVDGAIKILTVAVTIVVVAVPEGLPLVVTLTLAYSMRKMMADKALVRRLSACEKMGSATTICCDKTGTLTLNQMTVVEAYAGEEKIDPSDSNSQLSPMLSSLLIEGIAQNSNGSVYVPAGGGDVELSGSPTEKAILNWGIQLGMNFEAARSESSIIRVFPFNSEKKLGGVAVKLPNSEVHIHWKGAAEIVLASCKEYIDTNDRLVAMDDDKATNFKNKIDDMATRSLRCVAIAYRSYMENVSDNEEELSQWVLPDNDLVLLAVVGIKDPCQPSVKDAVRMCQIAGVKVPMVTEDNIPTARAIALECGILTSEADASESIIEGTQFRELPESEREERAEKISVMGLASPNDKLLLVQALRKRGHVVAVTGDGTNDVPALQEADIGLAKGIQGTEVAKESSDIIVLDDSFASVVKVVRWGRSVYANIQKFIQFQLTVNVAALVITIVAAFCSGDVPLNAVQLIWVNLIMDTLGALALATEPPTAHLMQRPPVGRREPLIIEPLIINITWGDRLMQAIYHLCVLLALNFNVVAFVIYIVSVVSSGDYPLNRKQTLLVTLIIDLLGSLTMAIERHTNHQLHRPPVGRRDNHVPVQSGMYSREPLITNIMWRNLLIQAIYQSGVLLVLNFYGKSLLNLEHDTSEYTNKVKNTLIFNSFVICQIFNEFNARKPDERNIFAGITKNHLFMGIVALTVVLQILIIEFLGKFTSTVRLNWKQWIISVVIGFIGWPLALIGKFISVPATPLSSIFKSNTQTG